MKLQVLQSMQQVCRTLLGEIVWHRKTIFLLLKENTSFISFTNVLALMLQPFKWPYSDTL